MITLHGNVYIPEAVIAAAEPIRMLNYKTTTPARFQKNTLTADIAGDLLQDIADRIGIDRARLDYVYFSAAQGAEPHTDLLDPEVFQSNTYVIPVILPAGRTVIEAGDAHVEAKVGDIYEFNHEETHGMTVEDTKSGCVLIMVAVRREIALDAEGQEIERLWTDALRTDIVVQEALGSIKQVHGPVDDMPDWPDAWESDKPFANVGMQFDGGDASVGIPDWSGLCLSTDQKGTVLGDILAARRDPALRHALLSLSPYMDPNDDPDQGRRDTALVVYRALGLLEGQG
ncbi:hypothetical protein CcrColossus_gp410 [Caulobacter phage CcrColossus]|uniref:Uncharacterized protein n=1 Tax=Caulobacter phage CcrColossus TaxID=1211640 RepID=K4JV87_9CAUD|nr:hypothetical protein CcrColossus_gp410 [Caulobacter phage CcrColossus]AFU88280.1 hypothetical protein CcrColossus_gp410 [Caulobacter phage CcrColossus]